MLSKNEVFKLKITDITNDGDGVGKTDSFVWFVKDAIPGDEIEASVMKLKKNYGYAKLVSILTPSPNRVAPKCPKAKSCGGCTLQCMSYQAQLDFKQAKVRNNLERIGGFSNLEIKPTIGMNNPWRYRNKAIVPVGKDKSGKVIAGFYASHSHDIIECEDCFLQPEEFKTIIRSCLSGPMPMSHILLRKGFRTNQLMAYAVENFDNNAVLSGKLTHIFGEQTITDYIGDLKFNISPRSFFQVNPIQVEALYNAVLDFAKLSGDETVWDLYCGIGTISLALAQHSKQVYGVEVVEDAIRDAKENARINGIQNARFFVGKAEDVLLQDILDPPDVIVVDPPRKGCDTVCLSTMVAMHPQRIVYVSCDSATLARDLKILCSEEYAIEKVQPVDMFPQTTHVECVVLMSRVEK